VHNALIRGRLPSRIHSEWVEIDYLDELGESGPFLEYWPIVRDLTLLDVFRARSILDHVVRAVELPGDLVECGTWAGGIGLLIGLAVRDLGVPKKVFLCDSFEGLPEPDSTIDQQYRKGEFAADADTLQATIDALGLGDVCELRKGLFADTLPVLAAERQFCFAHVDGDLYASTVDCVHHLHPRLAEGAPLVFDDYYDGSGGVALAVNELVRQTGEVVHLGPPPQAFVLKGFTPGHPGAKVTNVRTEDHVVPLSTTRLEADTLYQSFLTELSAFYAEAVGDFEQFVALCRGEPAKGAFSLRGGEVASLPPSRRWKRFLFTPGKPKLPDADGAR
jgi:hypothetical protein